MYLDTDFHRTPVLGILEGEILLLYTLSKVIAGQLECNNSEEGITPLILPVLI